MRAQTSFVVVSYASTTLTARLVASLNGAVDEVIVVDNGPYPSGLERLTDEYPGVRLLQPGDNLGYGAGANLGARCATGQVLFVANPDVEVDGVALGALTAAALQPAVAVVAPQFRNPDGTLQRSAHRRDVRFLSTFADFCYPLAAVVHRLAHDWHPTLHTPAQHEGSRDVVHVLGALLAIRREAFDAVGGFDPAFFHYREETDLCHRLRDDGWRIRHEPNAVAIHAGGASTDTSWPYQARPHTIASHYRYIAKHWGRPAAGLAWLLGLAGSALWWLTGPHRPVAARALRLHLRVLR